MRAAALATAGVLALLWVWRITYAATDLAGLAAIAVSLWAAVSAYRGNRDIRRAQLAAAFHSRSALSRLVTGRIRALAFAVAVFVISLPVLAWKALTAAQPEALALALVFLLSGITALWARRILSRHVTPAFAKAWGVAIAVVLVGGLAVPVLGWINYTVVSYPDAALGGNFAQTFQELMGNLPTRRGWIAEALTFVAVADAARLTLASRYAGSWPLVAIYCLDSALVCLIVAQTGALCTSAVKEMMWHRD